MKPVAMMEEPTTSTPSRRPAVSLAYDGGDPSHLEIAIPALTQRELSGTFFLPSIEALQRANYWQAAANEGHEMASHSLDGFTDERGNLHNWTLEMVEEDLRMSRKLLTELFPSQADFAFAFPGDQAECVSTTYNPQPTEYFEVIDRLFHVAKTAQAGTNPIDSVNPLRLKSIDAFGMHYNELVEKTERAGDEGSWLILNFRGIGSGELSVDAREHELFLDFLKFHAKNFEVVTVCQYARQITGSGAGFLRIE